MTQTRRRDCQLPASREPVTGVVPFWGLSGAAVLVGSPRRVVFGYVWVISWAAACDARRRFDSASVRRNKTRELQVLKRHLGPPNVQQYITLIYTLGGLGIFFGCSHMSACETPSSEHVLKSLNAQLRDSSTHVGL